MARFQFRMKPLLGVREQVRDFRRAQLAEAYAAQQKLETRREQLEAELSEQLDWSRRTAAGKIDVDRLLTANRYELVVRAEISVVEGHERELAVEIERRREALVAAEREVRVLEKLRERQLEQFRAEQALAESKELDEVAAQRFKPEEVA